MKTEQTADDGEAAKIPRSSLARIAIVSLPLIAIAYALDLYRVVGLNLYSQQFLAIVLAVTLPAIFLSIRIGHDAERDKIPWFDWVAATVGAGLSLYLLFFYPELLGRLHEAPREATIAGGVMMVLVLEGLRRTVGLTLVLVVVFFVVVGLAAHALPGELQGREVSPNELAIYVGLDPNGMLGLPLMICSTVIVMFIVFGELLRTSGGTSFFTDVALSTMGRYRGGAPKMAVVASGLFGSVSGSAVSNVVSTGIVTIPLMRKSGLRPRDAGAVEAVASTGGQLIPPIMGASAFLMAEFLRVPYSEVVLAALIPACLYYVALFVIIDLQSGLMKVDRVDRTSLPKVRSTLKRGWHYVLPFAVIVLALFQLNRPPETAAAFGLVSLLLLSLAIPGYSGRIGVKAVLRTLTLAGFSSLGMVMIGAAAGIIIGTLNVTAVGFSLTLTLVYVAEGSLLLLLLIAAAVCILLGMGMPTVGVYVLLAALVAPSLVELGVQPLTAHLFVLYFGMMSMITPPVALAAFAGANLAGAHPLRTAVSAMKFGWTAFLIPFVFVFEPNLLMNGDVASVALTIFLVVAGIWSVSVAMVGYLGHRLGVLSRIGFLLLGLTLIAPKAIAPSLLWGQFAALALLIAQCAFVYVRQRRHPARGY